MNPSDDGPLAWNVAGLLTDEPGADRILDVDGVTIDLGDDLALAEPVSGRVRLLRTNRGILATGDLHAALQLECSRCLREIDVSTTGLTHNQQRGRLVAQPGQGGDEHVEPLARLQGRDRDQVPLG